MLDGLNEQQRLAVIHEGGPLLVVAGAGSGKTRVLTSRIAYLLRDRGVSADQVIAITFTNKAAAEMRERVGGLVGLRTGGMQLSTFHSACVRILRRHSDRLGLPSSFSIYDALDSRRLLTQIAGEIGIDPKRSPVRGLATAISNLKNELIDPDQFAGRADGPAQLQLLEVYRQYQERLLRAGAVDFDDLISYTVELLRAHEAIAAEYRNRFRHVLVDEYQDTNHAQYTLVRELVGANSGAPAELVVVGDADQSIYAFRGATIRNIDQFERDFPNARVIMLEQNYRSTQTILSAANAVISRNNERREKRLWTAAGDGERIVGYVADDETDEAAFAANRVRELVNGGGVRPSDVAVFYRTNAQSRAFEEVFIRVGLPYRIVGGVRFYERREVRDIVAYLRVLSNPHDDVSLRRILNTPRRGIGDTAEKRIDQVATRDRVSFGEALRRVDESDGLPPRSLRAVREFVRLLDEFRAEYEGGTSLPDLVHLVGDGTGYLTALRESRDPQDEARVENLAELESVAAEFARDVPDATLDGFLERVSLVADADDIPDADGGMVTLMTLHTAKGLEFPVVFLTGLEETIFPHARSAGPGEVEEERRLAYVGITRARRLLHVSRAEVRRQWGTPATNRPSRFLAEIPEQLVDWVRTGSSAGFGTAPQSSRAARSAPLRGDRPGSRGQVLDLTAGDRVLHPKFGLGTVVEVAGQGSKSEAKVDFGGEGTRRLLLSSAPLERL